MMMIMLVMMMTVMPMDYNLQKRMERKQNNMMKKQKRRGDQFGQTKEEERAI